MPDDGYEPLPDVPLFGNGEARPRDRMLNAVIVVVTIVLVLITTISAFISRAAALDLFFVVCIILICISHLTLIVWYRQGDLDPKFKILIYYNTLCIILLCICGNVFFYS